jgi:hypothetical protein
MAGSTEVGNGSFNRSAPVDFNHDAANSPDSRDEERPQGQALVPQAGRLFAIAN